MDNGAVLIDDGGISVPERSWLETKAKPAQSDSTTSAHVDVTKSVPQSASTRFASTLDTTLLIDDSFREL